MITIGVLASQLGVPAATIRKWEQRYGFPRPLRAEGRARLYDAETLRLLRQAKRLIDQGIRPSVVFAAPEFVQSSGQVITSAPSLPPSYSENALLCSLMTQALSGRLDLLQQQLQREMLSRGILQFVEQLVEPLMQAVGDAWARGELAVFREHSIATVVRGLLNEAGQRLLSGHAPYSVLLAPLAGEQHTLGLAALKAVLSAAHVHCIDLGTDLPLDQIIAAAQAFRPNAVGLSISACYSARHAATFVNDLRSHLDTEIEVWLGGSGALQLRRVPPGVKVFTDARSVVLHIQHCEPAFCMD